MFHLSQNSLKNIEGINDVLIVLVKRAIQLTEVDFGIIGNGGKRTAEQQNALYKKGASKCDGYNKKSYHQSGNAVDLVHYDGKIRRYSWSDIDAYYKIHIAVFKAWNQLKTEGIIPTGIYLHWGGLWKSFKDFPHYELRNYAQK